MCTNAIASHTCDELTNSEENMVAKAISTHKTLCHYENPVNTQSASCKM